MMPIYSKKDVERMSMHESLDFVKWLKKEGITYLPAPFNIWKNSRMSFMTDEMVWDKYKRSK